ncbi:hypothetical protein FKM82_014983 [Ascaphus truei]
MKKFFQGIKNDIKFKSAGHGQRLSEDSRQNLPNDSVPKDPPKPRRPPTGDAQIAAASAAMARMDSQPGKGKGPMSRDTIRTQVKRELKAEQEAAEASPDHEILAAAGKEPRTICNVLFSCPLTGETLRKEERDGHIREAIQRLSSVDPTTAAIMQIHTFNKEREKVKLGVETVAKYLDNIISHPDEEKYHKIRLSNKVFQERIGCLEGAPEFFEAVGFEKMMLPVPGQEVTEEFYVLSNATQENLDALLGHRDALRSAEPLRATLERQPRIFTPSLQAAHFDLPDNFYSLTAEELKREQRQRTEALERNAMLRTKAMREKEEQRELRKYNYTVLRIRLPDGYILQGMFYARERVSALFDFVREKLQNDWLPFELLAPGGHKLEDDDQPAFYECGLVSEKQHEVFWGTGIKMTHLLFVLT